MGIKGECGIVMMTTMKTLAIFAVSLMTMMMTMMITKVMTNMSLVNTFYEVGLEVVRMTLAKIATIQSCKMSRTERMWKGGTSQVEKSGIDNNDDKNDQPGQRCL